jgi:hypothetical protein
MSFPNHGILITQGKCFKGESCSYAHNLDELKEIPNLLKTKICTHYNAGYCPNGERCNYAHGLAELRKLNMNSSSQICSYFQQGSCKFGTNCKFLHLTPDQSKYYDMKNKSSTLDRVPPWEYEQKFRGLPSVPATQPIANLVMPSRDGPISISHVPDTDHSFFEQNKDEGAGDFKFTMSYFK